MTQDLSKLTNEQLWALIRGVKPGNSAPQSTMLTPANIMAGEKQAFSDTVKDLPNYALDAVRSFGRGALDMPIGAGQLVTNLFGSDESKRQYGEAMKGFESDYQSGRFSQGPDIARGTGGVVTTLPLAGAPAPTLGGRMVQGAKVGGVLGLTSEVDPNAQDYAARKGMQVASGTVLGGASVPVAEGLIRSAGAVINKFVNTGKGVLGGLAVTPANIENQLQVEFQRGGVDWKSLSEEARKNIVSEVHNAIKGGGTLDAEAMSRMADFARVGIKPTQGQLTRNGYQWGNEQNLSKMEVGAPLADRFTEQNKGLLGAVDKARAGTGATSTDAYDAGQAITSGILSKDAPKKAAVTEAYDAFKQSAGVNAEVPAAPLAGTLGRVIEEHGPSKIPADVVSRLKEYGLLGGTQTKVLDLQQAEILRKLISNNTTFENSAAMKPLRQSIDDAINGMGSSVGADAANLLTNARGLAANRLGQIDRSPAMQAALGRSEQVAPEQFVDKFIIRKSSSVQDVANNLRAMPVEARAEARAAVLDWIKSKSVIGGTEDAAKFSQSGFNKAIEAIGPRKLELIFAGDKGTLETLRSIGRVGSYVQTPPVASSANTSGSATTLLDFLDKTTRLPIVGALMGKPSDIIRANSVSKALGNGIPVTPPNPFISPETMGVISPRIGILGGNTASQIPGILNR